MNRWLAILVATCIVGPGCKPSLRPAPPATWEYVVDAPPRGSRLVRVEASFVSAGTPNLAIDPVAVARVRDLVVEDAQGRRSPPLVQGQWVAPACVRRCTVRYQVDLGELAVASEDAIDVSVRVDETTVAPALSWLLHPEPNGDAPVTLRVRAPDPREFLTGLRRVNGREDLYAFRSPELDEGSFTAFGPMRRARVEVRGSTFDVALLGRPLSMSDADVSRWVGDAGAVASSLYDRFPVDHVSLFVMPFRDRDEVVFGKVLSLAGASVALLVGDKMPAVDVHRDWVLVHELFHLGFPSFRGEGRWLEEGLATYYEPVLRARAGWTSEPALWADFARQLHRGLPRHAGEGLDQRQDLDATYWGGALFALLADVRIRQATHDQRSLDDLMRACLARGGNATHVWRVADVVDLADELAASPVVSALYASQASRGEPFDLASFLDQLGVEPRGESVTLRDDRPLSLIRKAISAPLARGELPPVGTGGP